MEPNENQLTSYYHHHQHQHQHHQNPTSSPTNGLLPPGDTVSGAHLVYPPPPPPPPPQSHPPSSSSAVTATTPTTATTATAVATANTNANSTAPNTTPSSGLEGKRKRGRPRKYGTPEQALAAKKAAAAANAAAATAQQQQQQHHHHQQQQQQQTTSSHSTSSSKERKEPHSLSSKKSNLHASGESLSLSLCVYFGFLEGLVCKFRFWGLFVCLFGVFYFNGNFLRIEWVAQWPRLRFTCTWVMVWFIS